MKTIHYDGSDCPKDCKCEGREVDSLRSRLNAALAQVEALKETTRLQLEQIRTRADERDAALSSNAMLRALAAEWAAECECSPDDLPDGIFTRTRTALLKSIR